MTIPTAAPFTQERVRWIVAALIVVFYAVVLIFSANFPIGDDYALLYFLNAFIDAGDARHALGLIFAQHNEHRIVATKLVFLFCHGLLGEVNFRLICVLGALSYAGIFHVLVKCMPERCRSDPRILVFVACMVFQFGSAECLIWAMAGISNPLVIWAALFAIYCAEREDAKGFGCAIASSVLAVVTQGNGLIVPGVVVLQLASQRRWAHALVMLAATAATLGIYFIGFAFPAGHANPMDSFQHLGKIAVFALAFLGSAFGIGSTHHPMLTLVALVPTAGAGIAVVGVTMAAFYRRRKASVGALAWFNVFLILSATLAAVARHNFGLSQAMVSRYHIYSNLAVASSFLLAVGLLREDLAWHWRCGRFFRALPWFSLAYVPATFVLVLYFHFVGYAPIRAGELLYPDPAHAAAILEAAEAHGVFHRRVPPP